MIARLWCEGLASGRKIHRKRWEVITRDKQHEGMDFKEFETFNLGLLAKMVARVISEPNPR